MGMNKKEFITSLNDCRVDKNITINFMNEFSVADKFGSKYFNTEHKGMIKILRQLGANVNDVSYVDGKWYQGEAPESASEPVEELIDTITLVEEESVSEDVVEVLEEVVEVVEVEETTEAPEIEWDWINSLSNTKKDKSALDDWAEVTFNIKLNKRNTLPNMIADLKEQLGIEE